LLFARLQGVNFTRADHGTILWANIKAATSALPGR
jgi:hypothetical protein